MASDIAADDVRDLVAGRFAILPEPPRKGGMAEVYKAADTHDQDELCAVKRMYETPDDLLWRESFEREYRGLELAQHRNVVKLLEYGIDEDRQPYLAMEWLDGNLEDLITQSGPMDWQYFWRNIGSPILEAICWAQQRNLAHRDIKPRNVLLTDKGDPKLADFGISKTYRPDAPLVQNGRTFSQHGSAPFTPPEPDDGVYSFTRDSYSWAVLAISCVTGSLPGNYGDVKRMLADLPDGPLDVLAQATHEDPAQRHRYAALLRTELEDWVESRMSGSSTTLTCNIVFTDHCAYSLERFFGDDVKDTKSALIEDFQVFARVKSSSDGGDSVRIIGEQWVLHARRTSERPGLLLIEKAIKVGSAAAEKQREGTENTNLHLIAGPPSNLNRAEASLDDVMQLAAQSDVVRSERRSTERDRIYRVWQAYLRARFNYETGRGSALRYTDRTVNGSQVTFSLTNPPPSDLLGQDRLVSGGGLAIALQVVAVLGDQVTMRVTFGDPQRIPSQGVLDVNAKRAQSAIEKQRKALDDLAYDRSINPELAEVVMQGSGARAPLANAPWMKPSDKFDEDKVAVLRKALGVQDLLAVEGPPGTGKTRLIEEIIAQYLDAHPTHRVLLSSQTHAALDNVLERLSKRSAGLNMVRVGRIDNERIAPSAAEFLLERKAEIWAKSVREAARPWLAKQAVIKGINPDDLRAGSLAINLAIVIRDRENLEELERRAVAIAKEKANAEASAAIEDEGSSGAESRRKTEAAVDEAVDLKDKIASLRHDEAELRLQLGSFTGIAGELSKSHDPSELDEYAELLLGDGEEGKAHLALMRLQEEWLERVGRSSDFYSAMLASAKVVGSTCVALAGVRGVNEVAFDLCIVDEASKATATEVLIPMTRSRRSILVGDPKQLPPFFERAILDSDVLAEFDEAEIRENVFDRLLKSLPEASKAKLYHQYRMVRPIGNLVSEVFYGRELKSPIVKPEISFPSFNKLVTWLDTSLLVGGDPEVRVGTSWSSPLECRVVRSTLQQLDFVARNRKKTYDVAVIAGYSAQVRALEDAIRDHRSTWSGLRIRVNTVDAFQGSEADVCIYSVVRSNDRGDAGFLNEPPRLNVALSRARSLLLIVGDHAFCRGLPIDHPMSSVVEYIGRTSADCEIRTLNDA
ncbi:serine/threonine protein kinase [Rhizobium leguminosarum]|uniref:serine/threonine-protein kinase n=1 Tax=Rhizobium leguminosarum TaxID=384 RepID=UPI0016086731|nr:serine/threonine-protein kinase [Rhizobium leguminosarum]MBB4587908.1 serine/threonine protein kinase [Rhizobium leguminosarum]